MPPLNDNPYFTVTAKDPAKQYVADLMQKILDHWMESDEWRDKAGIPRKGREPDYIHGRWCIKCHNSLPDDWGIKPCDVCGAATGMEPLEGLTYDVMTEEPRTWPTYGGIRRSSEKQRLHVDALREILFSGLDGIL